MKKIFKFKICILFVLCFICFGCKTNEKNNNSIKEDYKAISISEIFTNTNTYEFEINNNSVSIIKENDDYSIYVNDTKVYFTISYAFTLEDKIYIFGNTLVYISNNNNAYSIYYIDFSKDGTNPLPLDIDNSVYTYYVNSYSVDNTGITYTIRNFNTYFLLKGDGNIRLDSCDIYKKYMDLDVEETYKIEYKGNGLFDDKKSLSKKKLSEFEDFSKLCD